MRYQLWNEIKRNDCNDALHLLLDRIQAVHMERGGKGFTSFYNTKLCTQWNIFEFWHIFNENIPDF